ncbi:MAG TPA: hypothetical protein VFV67_12535 [Actinophytocola sp.]|uniref:hypothetical protein n=1 Tax=Actinophytocola sp. TaxID=1872138 RepID=UPI002DBE94C2|nr:hypothetical protein [Actinophytocola sp.]HEU5471473.1 hypothetical protein [Actinophytocola sp.]
MPDAPGGSLEFAGATSTRQSAPRQVTENGLSVTVSAPKVFTPTEAASPRAPRAVAFDVVIDNERTSVYRPAQLSVTATSDGATAIQVIDSTQGYTGLVSATEEVPPGHNVRVAVAFALPAEPAAFRLIVQPDALAGSRMTVYQGTV